MGAFVLVVLGVAAFAGIIYAAAEANRRWKAALAYVADSLGLTYSEGGMLQGAETAGATDVGFVKVDSYTVSTGKSSTTYTRIVVDADDLPHDIVLEPEGVGASFKKVFVGEDYTLGDDYFDQSIVIRGRPNVLVSRLDAAARNATMVAVGEFGMKVKDGKVTFIKSGLIRDPERLASITRHAVGLARALSNRGRTIPARLFETATSDPSSQVRQRAAHHLWQGYPTSAEAQHLASAALDSDDPWLRLAGARRSNEPRAGQVLLELVQSGRYPNQLRASATEALRVSHLNLAGLAETIVPLAQRVSGQLLIEVLDTLRSLRQAPPLAVLATRTQSVTSSAKVAIAHSAALHGPAATSMLVKLLDDDEDTDVRVAAATALGHSAGLSGVEPLLPLTKGLFTSSALKEAARGAVEAIQQRSGGGDSGGLSVVDEQVQGGQLSPAEGVGQRGQLSPAQVAPARRPETVEVDDALTEVEAPA